LTPLPSITPLHGYSRLIIGRSVKNRAIEVYRFGAGRRERMIIAGIHGGDEHNTIALADALIEHLGQHPDLVPKGFTLYILRALNPDGDAAGRNPEDRLNANGVDLNRNFDTNWKSDWRSDGCASLPGTAGAAPGTEPETKAVKEFLRGRKIEALINYHSAGLGVFPSGEPAHPDSVRLAQAIAAISHYAYPPMDTGCEYTGTLVDWAANSGIPAAVDLELNSPTDTEFEDNLKVLELLLSFDVQRVEPTPPPTIDPALLFTPTRTRIPRTPTTTPTP
jgi:predicted deacylase